MTELFCRAARQAWTTGVVSTRPRRAGRGAARRRSVAQCTARRGFTFCGGPLLVRGDGAGAVSCAPTARPCVSVRP